MRHIHLDLVGGISGDMFIGAILDAFPDMGRDLQGVIVSAGFPNLVSLSTTPHHDGTLTGTRFCVSAAGKESYHHRHYSEIKEKLEQSGLAETIKNCALSIFGEIAEVEAALHGESIESVAFHEVGAWDSIADVVLAAHLISELDATWSVSSIPLGRGFVNTAHGRLPVPAPATSKLLIGFEVFDDGIEGERVTPTGAAILKALAPTTNLPSGVNLDNIGYGFGAKVFQGISNVLRVSVFTSSSPSAIWETDRVVQLRFEIDDQTPEQLSHSLGILRQEIGVLDVTQQPTFGKKQRYSFAVTLLVRPQASDAITRRCFELTTTLGIRRELVDRAVLRREEVVVRVNEHSYRVKVAHRPGGITAKVEMDDLMQSDLSLNEQIEVRSIVERLALENFT